MKSDMRLAQCSIVLNCGVRIESYGSRPLSTIPPVRRVELLVNIDNTPRLR